MANLQATFRALLAGEPPLAEVLERANRLFWRGTLASSYATLVIGRLGCCGHLELANAGHPSPLLVRGDEVVAMPASGVPLGMFEDGDICTCSYQLEPGDRLVVFTDGLTEAVSEAGEEYGSDRVGAALAGARALDARGTARATLEALARFAPPSGRRDDLTVMALRRLA
jgi:sigma-B regulation protein RsbU (phosphoserine phosphatase)